MPTPDKARLGVFVVSGVVLAVLGVLALGAGRLFEKTVPVHCYFTESVQGLETGSPISYRGVLVGRVESVSMRRPATSEDGGTGMHSAAIIRVRGALHPSAFLEKSAGFADEERVRETLREGVERGLRVRLAWKDITGQKYLDFDFHDPAEAAPPKLPIVPEEPYVPTYVSKSLQDIQKDLATAVSNLSQIRFEEIGTKIEQILDRVSEHLEKLKTDDITAALREATEGIRKLTESGELQRGLERVDSITAQAEQSALRLNELLAKPDLEAALTDFAATAKSSRAVVEKLEAQVPETAARLDGLLDEADRALAESKLPETTASIRASADGVGAAARNMTTIRTELVATMRELSQAARSVSRLADYLERRPDAILAGRSGGGGGQ